MKRLAIVTAVIGIALAPAAAGFAAGGNSLTLSDAAGTPSTSSPVTSNTVITVAATVTNTNKQGAFGGGKSQTFSIDVTDPNGNVTELGSQTVAAAKSASFSEPFDTSDVNGSGREAVNGTYTFSVTNGPSVSAAVEVPPAPVSGFAATTSGTQITFSWTANSEPDLVGYTLTRSGAGSEMITPSDAGCSSSPTCRYEQDFGTAAQGKSYTFGIVADRSRAPGDGWTDAVGGTQPETVSASFVSASPSPTPSTSGTTSPSPGNSSPGTVITKIPTQPGNGKVDGIGNTNPTKNTSGLQGFVPPNTGGLAAPSLPGADLPGVSLPGGEGLGTEALPQGTYKAHLSYPSIAGTPEAESGSGSSVTSEVVSVLDLSQLWRSLALAAVLLLVGSHVMAWLRRTPDVD